MKAEEIENVKKIASGIYVQLVKKDERNVMNIILLSMAVVEKISKIKKMTSREKLEMAIEILPYLLDFLSDRKVISSEVKNMLSRIIEEDSEKIANIIESAIRAAQLHELFDEEVVVTCFPCLRKKK